MVAVCTADFRNEEARELEGQKDQQGHCPLPTQALGGRWKMTPRLLGFLSMMSISIRQHLLYTTTCFLVSLPLTHRANQFPSHLVVSAGFLGLIIMTPKATKTPGLYEFTTFPTTENLSSFYRGKI